jgi:uncharacterized Ntn-hydrolase superfamily protein
MTQVYDGREKNGYATDVAGDKVAAVENPLTGTNGTSIVIYDLTVQKSQSYPIPSPYKVAGEARLSRSGDRVIYETAIGEPDEEEEYALYMIDLATGRQSRIGGEEKWMWSETAFD